MKTKRLLIQCKTSVTIFLILLLFSISTSCYAQEARTEIEVKNDVLYDIKVSLSEKLYTISISKNGGGSPETFVVSSFTSKILNNFVLQTYNKHNSGAPISTSVDLDFLKSNSALKFMELVGALYNTEVSGQDIAIIEMDSSIDVFYLKKRKDKNLANKFIVGQCQFVFEDGFIKTIIAKGELNSNTIIFSNRYAIGISTRANNQSLSNQRLFNENSRRDSSFIYVSDLITYMRIGGVRTNDYSPADQAVVIVNNSEESRTKTVSKSPSTKLFTLNIFSDFAGVNQNNPNGLIQTEFSKRINFWTSRRKFLFNSGAGMFTHLIPSFEISKIEQNNRYMPISEGLLNGNTNSTYYVSPFETFRYSVARVATELNIVDIQGAAINIHINGFVGVSLTNVRDSIVENGTSNNVEENINTVLLGGNLKFIFNPESKWSFQMKSQTTHLSTLNDKFNYFSSENGRLESANQWMHTAEFLITWNTNGDNKLFGRFRFNNEIGYAKNNYSEFQIGYSIFFKSAKKN